VRSYYYGNFELAGRQRMYLVVMKGEDKPHGDHSQKRLKRRYSVKNDKDMARSKIWYLVLLCCFVAVAIYGMSSASLTVGLLLLAAGCSLYAVEKARIHIEDVSMPGEAYLLKDVIK
jgi:hypothetical protein